MTDHGYEIALRLPRKAGGERVITIQTEGWQRAQDWRLALARRHAVHERAITITRLKPQRP